MEKKARILGRGLFLHDRHRRFTLMAAGMFYLLVVGIWNSWAIAIRIVSAVPRPGEHKNKAPCWSGTRCFTSCV